MIKVMIVDDEPFIRQGLKILIDWEKHGFDVCGEASNGEEAIAILQSRAIDLVITDIKMPQMNGIELIDHVRTKMNSRVKFIILSGFFEFEYAKKAIKYEVVDYVLKPVQREELLRVLEEYKQVYYATLEELRRKEYSRKLLLDQYLSNLICEIEEVDLEDTSQYLCQGEYWRYIGFEYDVMEDEYDNLDLVEKRKYQRVLYDTLKKYMGKDWYHVYLESTKEEQEYVVGLIFVDSFAKDIKLMEKEYFKQLYMTLKEVLSYPLRMYVGTKVNDITKLGQSYRSVELLRSIPVSSRDNHHLLEYDEIRMNTTGNKYLAEKDTLDILMRAIEENQQEVIENIIAQMFAEVKNQCIEPEVVKLTLNYILFNMLYISKEIDSNSDHEEIFKIITQNRVESMSVHKSIKNLKRIAIEFAVYISQIRQHTFGGVLKDIEREITENYMENLSLKYLSEKYFINSAYLGQIFKKQYGIPFKDYLNNYRIDRAAEMLIRSDDKIYHVANAVGFNNTDYFINKFVQLKGITPLQYRKQLLQKQT